MIGGASDLSQVVMERIRASLGEGGLDIRPQRLGDLLDAFERARTDGGLWL